MELTHLCNYKDHSNISLFSDDYEFYIKIQGLSGETYLTVGYSCPNGASMQFVEDSNAIKMVDAMKKSLDQLELLDLDEMVKPLYDKLKEINSIYNQYI